MASTLHALFQYAVNDRKRLDNPEDDPNLPEVAQADLSSSPLDDDERLAEALGPAVPPSCGSGRRRARRWAERAGITVGDLDLDDATLKAAFQLDRDEEISPTKNKTTGTIDLSEAMVKNCPSTWATMSWSFDPQHIYLLYRQAAPPRSLLELALSGPGAGG